MKKTLSSILATLTLFVGLSGTALANDGLVEAHSHNHESSSGIELQASYCGYYLDGNHKVFLKAKEDITIKDTLPHDAVITNPDGSKRTVNCYFLNYYEVKTYDCVCGQATSTIRTFKSNGHSVLNHS